MKMIFDTMTSPVGELMMIAQTDGVLKEIKFLRSGSAAEVVFFQQGRGIFLSRNRVSLEPIRSQLEAYFSKKRRNFDVKMAAPGTKFQKSVWNALTEIPYGETRSYGEIARRLEKPGASRAVGRANAGNPIPIVVPCHRVIGADGSLTGFAGGLDIKAKLLELEGASK